MKIHIKGDTPMERLINLTRGILAVPKDEIERTEKKRQQKKPRRRAKPA